MIESLGEEGNQPPKLPCPPGWALIQLGEICNVALGKTPGKDDYQNEGSLKIVKYRDLGNDREIDWTNNTKGFIDQVCVKRLNLRQLREGDVLISASAHSSEIIGRKVLHVHHLPEEFDAVYFVGEILCIRSLSDEMPHLSRLLNYFFQSAHGYKSIQSKVHGVHLIGSRAAEMVVPIPPKSAQQRIVSKIDELFSRIDEGERALERVQKLVERYRQSVLKAAVTGELTRDWREKNKDQLESGEALLARILKARREAWEKVELDKMKAKGVTPANDKWKQKYEEPAAPDTAGLPELPKGWAWTSLPMLCQEDSTSGISVKGSESPPGVPALRLDAMNEKGFDYSARRYIPISEGVAEKLAIRRGDFFISRANGSIRFVGRGVLAPTPPERIVFPDTMIRYRLVESPDIREWLIAIWPSRLMRGQIEAKAKTTAGIYKISQQDISTFAIPLPPLDEQFEATSRMDQGITRAAYLRSDIQASLTRSSSQRQAILVSAFSGRLVPQCGDDEPASALLERIVSAFNDTPAKPKRGRKPKTSEHA